MFIKNTGEHLTNPGNSYSTGELEPRNMTLNNCPRISVVKLQELRSTTLCHLTHRFGVKNHLYPVWEKAMAIHSSTLAWKIPWTEEPGRLQSMGSLGVGHN